MQDQSIIEIKSSTVIAISRPSRLLITSYINNIASKTSSIQEVHGQEVEHHHHHHHHHHQNQLNQIVYNLT
jgi:hypothetical protein